ncbi:MAG: hypothetical protein H6868_09320 [Rhodospirillales bacterium]|nr:hypothetical protein [Rhodospirillales bacterium]
MWVFVWLLLSSFLLGIFFWQSQILWQQKKAWSAFAQKNSLQYIPGKFSEAPSVTGKIGRHHISLFSDSRMMEDMRSRRFMTVVEIVLGCKMPAGGVVATFGMKPFVDTLIFHEEIKPEMEGWGAENLVRTDEEKMMKAFLTPERLKVLQSIFSMKGANAIFLFDKEAVAFRIETADPLHNSERIDKIVKQFLRGADKLSVDKEEYAALKALVGAEDD